MSLCVRLLLLLTPAVWQLSFASEDGPDPASAGILDRYMHATETQARNLRGVTMEVEISAEIPRLNKKGKLHALRQVSRLGRITYDLLRFEGDNTVKKELIARYLAAEVEATPQSTPSITPEHYKFKYKGVQEKENGRVHVFGLTPKKKLAGTFKGELWLDRDTCLPLREGGRLSKNPSVFVKSFDFVRTYEIRDGVAVPKQTTGTVQTRLWGKAKVNIDFNNFTKLDVLASEAALLGIPE
ncbi:MAG: hypothetical protein HY235_14970 [Acidobacteria bacterium]|nr:hypothetical protein [Acidobacteriota bacterium]